MLQRVHLALFIILSIHWGCDDPKPDTPAVCGNSKLEPSESCDGSLLGQSNCQDVGQFFGTPTCGNQCSLESGSCRDFELTGSDRPDIGFAVAEDSSGNVFVVGGTQGELDGQLQHGGIDIVLIKYNKNGQKEWTRQWGTESDDIGMDVTVDSDGDIYITGETNGPLEELNSFGSSDVFAAKLSSDGALVWTRQWGTAVFDGGASIAVDDRGGILISGFTEGILDGQPHAVNYDVFLTKLTGGGEILWTRQWGSQLEDTGYDLAVDAAGNSYITGKTLGSIDGETSRGASDAFLTKFDSSGVRQWTRQFGTGSDDSGWSVREDPTLGIAVVGTTQGIFEGQSSTGLNDVFLAIFNQDGIAGWTRQWGSGGSDYGVDVAIAEHRVILVCGNTSEEMTEQPSNGNFDFFLTALDFQGTPLFSRQWGSEMDDYCEGLAMDSNGNTLMTGQAGGRIFNQDTQDSSDIFLYYFSKILSPE